MSSLLLILCFFPVWLPVLVACLARQSPPGIQVVLALAGITSGFYARSIYTGVARAGGHESGRGVLLVPFTTAALSFYLAFTGVALVTAFHFVAVGRTVSLPGFLALGLAIGSVGLGIFVVLPFIASPFQ